MSFMRTAVPTAEELSSKTPSDLRIWAANCRKKVLELTQKDFLSTYEEELLDLMAQKARAIDAYLASPKVLLEKERLEKRKAEVLKSLNLKGDEPKDPNPKPLKKRLLASSSAENPDVTFYREVMKNGKNSATEKESTGNGEVAEETSGWSFNEKGI